MPGELLDDSVVIKDQKEGTQLYNKGNFGYPMRGGGLELDLVEAAFLVECDRLEIMHEDQKMTFESIFRYSSSVIEGFDILYLVYRDIRQRGFVVKAETGHFDLSVFPRGFTMSDSRPLYMVRAVSERSILELEMFSEEVCDVESKGKKLLYGVVDEEGDLTYYHMSKKDPKGKMALSFPKEVEGCLIGDRVIVFDGEGAESLINNGYYGKMMDTVLQLSLIESCYLMENKALAVSDAERNVVSREDLLAMGSGTQEEFDIRLRTFRDLREKGMVVKTGFKYGAHFRVYEGSPDDDHARFLVHAVPADRTMMWPEISRTVRLSGGVKKEIMFCRVGDSMEYLEFKWFRP